MSIQSLSNYYSQLKVIENELKERATGSRGKAEAYNFRTEAEADIVTLTSRVAEFLQEERNVLQEEVSKAPKVNAKIFRKLGTTIRALDRDFYETKVKALIKEIIQGGSILTKKGLFFQEFEQIAKSFKKVDGVANLDKLSGATKFIDKNSIFFDHKNDTNEHALIQQNINSLCKSLEYKKNNKEQTTYLLNKLNKIRTPAPNGGFGYNWDVNTLLDLLKQDPYMKNKFKQLNKKLKPLRIVKVNNLEGGMKGASSFQKNCTTIKLANNLPAAEALAILIFEMHNEGSSQVDSWVTDARLSLKSSSARTKEMNGHYKAVNDLVKKVEESEFLALKRVIPIIEDLIKNPYFSNYRVQLKFWLNYPNKLMSIGNGEFEEAWNKYIQYTDRAQLYRRMFTEELFY